MTCFIIGSGVQGLSTGILLEHLGYKTEILTKNIPYVDGDDIPTVSTDYAAASIYPVKIAAEYSEDELIRNAERTFEPFFNTPDVPVRKQTHYYLYEQDNGITLPERMNITHIDEYEDELPSREQFTVQDGYVCEEYFVEMPEYIPLLYELYKELGGEITKQHVTRNDITELNDSGIVFNCSGYGSKSLFDDDSMKAIKGHILETDVETDIETPLSFAYTYTPRTYNHYTYMYPRRNSVIFGGSYLEGDIINGEWVGESPEKPINVDGDVIPQRLYRVNQEIMSRFTGITVNDLSVKHGFRPYREDGMRIEQDEDGVIHNYGHGGSGVSMSWWSALKAINHIDSASESVLHTVSSEISNIKTELANKITT